MRLVICGESALRVYEKLAASRGQLPFPTKARSLEDCMSGEREINAFCQQSASAGLLLSEGQLHVLVNDVNAAYRSNRVRRHTWSTALPAGTLCRLDDGVFVTCPEFSLLVISQKCAFNDLVVLCCQACGQFGLDASGVYERPPITSLSRISAFLDRIGEVRGAGKLRRALRYAFDAARSPLEVAVAIMMSYPVRMGGYGFPKPILNHRFALPAEVSQMAGRSFVEFDFYFADKRVAVEYDSNQEHTGSARITRDARRNNALRYMGVSVTNLTWWQVRDPQAFDDAMRQVARYLGLKVNGVSKASRARRIQLRADVLPPVRDR